jgi:hypothetical protein
MNKHTVSICQANSVQGDRVIERERERDRDRERAKDRDRERARVRDRDWEREREREMERERERDRIEDSSNKLKRHCSSNHPRLREDSDKNSPCTPYLSLASAHTVADRHTETSDLYSKSIPQYTDEDFDLELKRAYEGSSRAVSRTGPKAVLSSIRSGYHSDGRQGLGFGEDKGRVNDRNRGRARQAGLYSG